jgi:hypothetical protein
MKVIAIDPGLDGAIVIMGDGEFSSYTMPTTKNGDYNEVDFAGLSALINELPDLPYFVERAMPMAMGSKHAFNYGRGFAAIEIAIQLAKRSVTYVEPLKWSKVMHEGIDTRFTPKVKSVIAIERLYPTIHPLIPRTPKSKKLHLGVVDATLIAGYGIRKLGAQ